jgi:hypothetical protein
MSIEMQSIFVRLGRAFFSRMQILLFLLVLSIPPLCAGIYLFTNSRSFLSLHEQFEACLKKAKGASERRIRNERFLVRHKKPDPYFLDKEIEAMSFLIQERNQLRNWASHPAISNKELVLARLNFLESDQNRLSFVEENIQSSRQFKETVEKQRHPIEMNNDDLKILLSRIEDYEPNIKDHRPQLIISEFTLCKKKTPLDNEVFEIQMNLLRREFDPE